MSYKFAILFYTNETALMIRLYTTVLILFFSNSLAYANTTHYTPQTIDSHTLQDFNSNPSNVQNAIRMALDLAGRNIGYQYGSANPSSGGMDCSGTINYLLTQLGIKNAPRSSEDLYHWVKKEGHFYSITTTNDIHSKQLSHLKPGDLLFWSGTYKAADNIFVTHTMMYLGKNKQGEPLMIGASNGRTYKGKQIYGVSVFDFILPPLNSNSKFLGYSCIPQFTC